MSKAGNVFRAGVRRLAGMRKKSDGIALGDEKLKKEGEREQESARQAWNRSRPPGRPKR
ncbi:hypothetical protein [Streptomyces sp. NPDC058595]|uniref:hypothetical protein n=1 Tax=Streptomyces sp. NPDC058595 TaxID=3346550 RepID=UPI00364E9FB2